VEADIPSSHVIVVAVDIGYKIFEHALFMALRHHAERERQGIGGLAAPVILVGLKVEKPRIECPADLFRLSLIGCRVLSVTKKRCDFGEYLKILKIRSGGGFELAC
jgi:hypothetical protein